MAKKLKLMAFLLLISLFVRSEDQPELSRLESPSYGIGRALARGFVNEASLQIEGSKQETFKKFVQDLLSSAFSAIDHSLEGENFNKMNESLARAIEKFMVSAADGMRGGAKAASKDLKDAMKETTLTFADGAKDSAEILSKSMQQNAETISDGLGKSVDFFGEEAQKKLRKGSEFDKGLDEFKNTTMGHVSDGINTIWGTVNNNMMKTGGIAIAVVAGVVTVQYGIPLAYKMIERALMRPKLIIASSKKTILEYLQSLFSASSKELPMIFSPSLQHRLSTIIEVTSMISKKIKEGKTNVKYRNLMLYGPPGTGKTLFATELAKCCGLEYAFMSGSSFSKFKDGEGIEALDELFAWANKSKGLLIFIDEAETFLSKRENMDTQSKAYLLLNNFLNYTGTRSDKFMIVFATNHKEVLDCAIYRRIDDLVEMPLPGRAERIRILNLYKDTILMDAKQNDAAFIQSVIRELPLKVIETIGDRTKGLSGGDLEGIINSLKTEADILDPAIITRSLVDAVVGQAIDKHIAFTGGKMLGVVEN